jgi:hypothetical protein
MAIDPRKRQKKLAKQRSKRKAKALEHRRAQHGKSSSISSGAIMEFELASRAPVYECYVADEIFDKGMGQVIVSRLTVNDQVAAGIFLVDAYCLGVKDAFAGLRSRWEFADFLDTVGRGLSLRRCEPEYAKKLVVDAIAYARDLGFEPHKDFKLASKVLSDIDETACTTEFTFGKDGKPFYMSGPNETEARSRQIIDTLLRRCGPEGFHYLVGVSPFDDLFGVDEFEDDDDDDDDDDK